MSEYDSHLEYEKCSEALKNAIQAWIALVVQPAKSEYWRSSSYGLKHDFEYSAGMFHSGLYMTNGEFKGAMLAAGYEPVDRNEQNWTFKLKPRSPFTRWSQKHWNCNIRGSNICLCHCTQQERDGYADVVAKATEKPPVYVRVPIKRVRHKQTIGPWECHCCHLTWYGNAYDNNNDMEVVTPPGKVLCYKCHSALDDYLFTKHRSQWNECQEDQCDEKKRIQFQAIANRQLKDMETHARERRYKGVPRWMQSAIEQGKVITNAKDVYIVTEENSIAVEVEIVEEETIRFPRRRVM